MIRKSKSERGQPVLHIGGHVYHRNRVSSKGTTYWRCANFPRCRGTAIEKKNAQPTERLPHTCESNPEMSRIREIESDLKENVENTSAVAVKTIYEQSLAIARAEGIDHLLSPYESVSNTLHRRRRHLIPTASQSAFDVLIPQHIRMTDAGEDFLQLDMRYLSAHGDQKRLLIFGSPEGVQRLAASQVWCYDGTFQLCPAQFHQLFVIHGATGQTFYPCIYCLMEQRDRSAYNALANGLIELASTQDLVLRPDVIISDFETASYLVFSQIFQARMVGCLFHYRQSLYRWFIQNHLKSYYEAHASVRLLYRTMSALALLPHQFIETVFDHYMQFFRSGGLDDLQDTGFNTASTLDSFEAYYRRQWIRNAAWMSVHGCPFRTNNACEAFNSIMTSKIDAHKPGLFKMIEFLKASEATTSSRIRQMALGTATTVRRTKYIIIDEKIQKLSCQLEEGIIDPVAFVALARHFFSHTA